MDINVNANAFHDRSEMPIQKQASNGIRVRDMIRKYDTARKSDSTSTSYSSIISTKSAAYFGAKANTTPTDNSSNSFFDSMNSSMQDLRGSSESDTTVRPASIEMQNDIQITSLEKQKSFMNLSRTREPPKAAPREKKPRHSAPVLQDQEKHIDAADTSYQSKTTISKTPSGVRIIIDIFFDQNKQLTVQDVIGSRIETDIPPSQILTEFQKRMTQSAQN